MTTTPEAPAFRQYHPAYEVVIPRYQAKSLVDNFLYDAETVAFLMRSELDRDEIFVLNSSTDLEAEMHDSLMMLLYNYAVSVETGAPFIPYAP